MVWQTFHSPNMVWRAFKEVNTYARRAETDTKNEFYSCCTFALNYSKI